ncbi:hypothetical protein [Streptomyces sp. NPDC059649]|uniref:hypothetical protein n=1 Tax=Streptomyces sp. NPDC059649 TaxID=3346895 RepID=UPI0036866F38
MLTACTLLAAAGPGPSLLAALGAWTWLGIDPADTDHAHLLLAHPPGPTGHDTAQAIEFRMRHLAASLGGLAEPQDSVPDLGERLLIVDATTVLLRFRGSRFGARLPVRPGWTRHVRDHGQAVVVIGLDPLPRSADLPRVDAYLDAGLASGRLLFGLARPA